MNIIDQEINTLEARQLTERVEFVSLEELEVFIIFNLKYMGHPLVMFYDKKKDIQSLDNESFQALSEKFAAGYEQVLRDCRDFLKLIHLRDKRENGSQEKIVQTYKFDCGKIPFHVYEMENGDIKFNLEDTCMCLGYEQVEDVLQVFNK